MFPSYRYHNYNQLTFISSFREEARKCLKCTLFTFFCFCTRLVSLVHVFTTLERVTTMRRPTTLFYFPTVALSKSSRSPINLGDTDGKATMNNQRQYNSGVTFRPFVRKVPSYKEMIVRLARRYDMEKERLEKVDFPPMRTLKTEVSYD